MIQFKDDVVRFNFFSVPIHPTLLKILWWIGETRGAVVTSAYREGDHGVHGTIPYRGLDIRSWCYPDPQGVVDAVNARWIYDPERPEMRCAVMHDSGHGVHIHLQVCEKTKRRA